MRPILPYLGASLAALTLAWATPVECARSVQGCSRRPLGLPRRQLNCSKKGIIDGYPDNFFRGKRTLTRYEFAIALKRALDKIAATPGVAGPQPARKAPLALRWPRRVIPAQLPALPA